MAKQQLKEVEAIRQGSYDGHRRRVGQRFYVAVDAREPWFVDIGPAPEDAELPDQLENAQAPRGRSFIEVMRQLAGPKAPVAPKPQTLSEAAADLPQAGVDPDLVG